jgi:hypothetical protein
VLDLRILQLRVQHISATGERGDPWFARAHIIVGNPARESQSNNILLTTDCRTAGEIASYVDQMIEELEQIKLDAKTML